MKLLLISGITAHVSSTFLYLFWRAQMRSKVRYLGRIHVCFQHSLLMLYSIVPLNMSIIYEYILLFSYF